MTGVKRQREQAKRERRQLKEEKRARAKTEKPGGDSDIADEVVREQPEEPVAQE